MSTVATSYFPDRRLTRGAAFPLQASGGRRFEG